MKAIFVAKGLCKSGTPLTVVTNDRDLRIRLRGVAGDSRSVCVLDRADVIQLLSLECIEEFCFGECNNVHCETWRK